MERCEIRQINHKAQQREAQRQRKYSRSQSKNKCQTHDDTKSTESKGKPLKLNRKPIKATTRRDDNNTEKNSKNNITLIKCNISEKNSKNNITLIKCNISRNVFTQYAAINEIRH
jgi:hypothetical protein